jgi:hypothetical protein
MVIRQRTVETVSFNVQTIGRDIEEGKCGLIAKCMEKLAIEPALRVLDPGGGDHRVRIDAGSIKFMAFVSLLLRRR